MKYNKGLTWHSKLKDDGLNKCGSQVNPLSICLEMNGYWVSVCTPCQRRLVIKPIHETMHGPSSTCKKKKRYNQIKRVNAKWKYKKNFSEMFSAVTPSKRKAEVE